jgi:hypothetical protein
MSGSHPVAPGSIPGVGYVFFLFCPLAFVVKWHHSCLPSSWRGFDSPRTQDESKRLVNRGRSSVRSAQRTCLTLFSVLLAQLAEHPLNISIAVCNLREVGGSIPPISMTNIQFR